MGKDWHAWYRDYDDPGSSMSRRLRVVREQLSAVLGSTSGSGPVRLLSLCAGDGRDTLPVLAEAAPDTSGTLVELDPALCARAEVSATALGLAGVTIRRADAGDCASLAGAVPADVVLACGVFGNVSQDDVAHTVSLLPSLLAPGGVVIWTRGRRAHVDPVEASVDPAERVRRWFGEHAFEEVAFVRPDDAGFRVGVHRFLGDPRELDPSARLFTFAV